MLQPSHITETPEDSKKFFTPESSVAAQAEEKKEMSFEEPSGQILNNTLEQEEAVEVAQEKIEREKEKEKELVAQIEEAEKEEEDALT